MNERPVSWNIQNINLIPAEWNNKSSNRFPENWNPNPGKPGSWNIRHQPAEKWNKLHSDGKIKTWCSGQLPSEWGMAARNGIDPYTNKKNSSLPKRKNADLETNYSAQCKEAISGIALSAQQYKDKFASGAKIAAMAASELASEAENRVVTSIKAIKEKKKRIDFEKSDNCANENSSNNGIRQTVVDGIVLEKSNSEEYHENVCAVKPDIEKNQNETDNYANENSSGNAEENIFVKNGYTMFLR